MKLNELWMLFIAQVKVANDKAEDGHLNAHGEEFYSVHLTFAKIQDGLSDGDTALDAMPDSVLETYFGGRGLPFPSSNEILALEQKIIPKISKDSRVLGVQVRNLLMDAMKTLSEIIKSKDTSDGENDMAAAYSRELQHRLYFLNRYLA